MPPRGRRETSLNEHIYNLGERGRKTGVFLKDTGIRDEHGMQPPDDIFSSPQKENGNQHHIASEEDESEEEVEMDIDNVTAPDPVSFMKNRNGIQLPIPRGRSPPKTNLQSPAVKSAHLGPSSSPERGTIVAPREISPARSVKRRLDFSMQLKQPATNREVSAPTSNSAANNDATLNDATDEEDEEAILHGRDASALRTDNDESMAIIDAGGDDDGGVAGLTAEPETDTDMEDARSKAAPARRRGRPPKKGRIEEEVEEESAAADESALEALDEPVQRGKKRGRPAKEKNAQNNADTESAPKRRRSNRNTSGDEAEPSTKTKKVGRPKASENADAAEPSKASKGKASAPAKGRRRKSVGAADTSLAEIPRGPPLPKSRGLTILRREAPGDAAGTFRTRSGRNSFKPLAFWRNEHLELQEQIMEDAFSHGKSHFVLPTVKEIVRVDEPEEERKRRAGRRPTKSASKKGKRRVEDEDEDDGLREAWEEEPGIIEGEVLVWQPEHEFNPPGDDDQVEVLDDRLAIAAPAIKTQEVRNATFGFTKTLSLPFFGSGVVDLPPGAEKRSKNSRKMHMTFFVYTGRVRVTVAQTTFRIGKGGMWFVPRGNYYSIENDYDNPSRIFFAQGCEVPVELAAEGSYLAE
ncbi:Centromere protein 3 [Pleurostoma richardsiae]|uniref:CENP-C homolog n=1 Tax=Pleurostoma richardsiae TaxID=41990 RepID=A0AA38RC48_9PEZI|nr:Centromere protein 3 [Pleurostoma richardsiae]